MTVAWINSGAKASAGSGGITLAAPASPVSGDIWIAAIHSSDQVAHTLSGWSQLFQANGGGTTSRLSVWWFRYAGSAPNLIVGHTSGATIVGGIAAFRAASVGTAPAEVASAATPGTDATIELTGLTPGIAGCMLIAVDGAADDNARSQLPTGFAACFEDAAGGTQNCYQETAGNPDGSVALHWKLHTTSATGNFVDTQAAADPWCSILIALRPQVVMAAGVGAITFAGIDAGLKVSRKISAEVGPITFSGVAASLKVGRKISTGTGAITFAGVDAGLKVARRVAAEVGAIGVAGVDAGLKVGRKISAEVGAIDLSGTDAGLKVGRRLAAETGPISVAFQDADLVYGLNLTQSVTVVGVGTGAVATLSQGTVEAVDPTVNIEGVGQEVLATLHQGSAEAEGYVAPISTWGGVLKPRRTRRLAAHIAGSSFEITANLAPGLADARSTITVAAKSLARLELRPTPGRVDARGAAVIDGVGLRAGVRVTSGLPSAARIVTIEGRGMTALIEPAVGSVTVGTHIAGRGASATILSFPGRLRASRTVIDQELEDFVLLCSGF